MLATRCEICGKTLRGDVYKIKYFDSPDSIITCESCALSETWKLKNTNLERKDTQMGIFKFLKEDEKHILKLEKELAREQANNEILEFQIGAKDELIEELKEHLRLISNGDIKNQIQEKDEEIKT